MQTRTRVTFHSQSTARWSILPCRICPMQNCLAPGRPLHFSANTSSTSICRARANSNQASDEEEGEYGEISEN